VVAAMRAEKITLRGAQLSDCRILWEWANEKAVRQASFEPSAISWEEHSRWFAKQMGDPASTLLMFEDGVSTPAGTVRFHATTRGDAEISITIGPEFRGHGLAPYFLDRAVERVFAQSQTERMNAFIRVENPASARSFELAGFHLVGTTQVKGNEGLHYVREREGVANIGAGDRENAAEMARCR
jgi:RimJ/RimL family protein N-acetyltransferase